MENTWHYLVNKTRKRPFLGTLCSKREIIKKYKNCVCVSLESQYRNTGIMCLISASVFWVLTWKAYPYSMFVGILFLMVMAIAYSVAAIFFLACRRRVVLDKAEYQACFLWGMYPFVKTLALDSKELYVGLENIKINNSQQTSTVEQIYIADDTGNKVAIVKSKKCHAMMLSTLKEMESILKVIT